MRKIRQQLLALGACVLILTGCIVAPAPGATPTGATDKGITQRIVQHLQAGETLNEIAAIDRPLPEHVAQEQLQRYFRLGDLIFALALRPSMNVPLTFPKNFTPTFAGLLISAQGAAWQPYLQLKDRDATAKNNPYYLWLEDDALYLTVVDQLGAGSGEGNLKLLRLATDGVWTVAGCYYFGFYSGTTPDGDYFAASRQLDRQQPQAAALCDNLLIEPLSISRGVKQLPRPTLM